MSVDLVGFLGVVLVAYVVPGPDFLVVMKSAAENPARGRAPALGAQSGLCVHMLAAALGLSVIAARSPLVAPRLRPPGCEGDPLPPGPDRHEFQPAGQKASIFGIFPSTR
jgi:hypothetical protein